jgi:ribosomal protein S13
MELGKVVQAIVDRKSNNSESMIVANHLTQMVMFMCHQGLEFVTPQDNPTGDISKFIVKTLADNRLDMYYRGIATLFVATGGILWFIQPTLQGYSIYWFHSGTENDSIEDVKSQYKCIYTPNGRELKEVIVRYEYYDTSNNPLINTMGGPSQNKKWVRLRITDATIVQEFFSAEPILDIYGVGLKTSLNLHKKIGLNIRKSPLKLKKNQQNYFKNQLNLIPNNKELKINLNKISKFLIKIKKSKKIKFYKDDNKKTKIKTDRKK